LIQTFDVALYFQRYGIRYPSRIYRFEKIGQDFDIPLDQPGRLCTPTGGFLEFLLK
jgi:hypothetical protein